MNLLGRRDNQERRATRRMRAARSAPDPVRSLRTIESRTLRLEPLVAAHAEEMFRPMSDRAIYAYMPLQPPASASALRQRYAHLERGRSADGRERWLNWVVRVHSRECVGFVQTTLYPGLTADFAFAFAPAYWGRGVAFEACQAVLPCLRRDFAVRVFYATVDPRNARSIRLLGRLGFRAVPAADYPHGEVEPEDLVFALPRRA
jgi:ribosomal-protein-alanine N-acetyltransferase